MTMKQINLSSALAIATTASLFGSTVAVAAEGADQPNIFTGDLGNIIWSLATFLVVLIVLGKFAWGPILGALQKREEFIRDSLQQAKRDREAAEARLKEYGDKLDAAKREATAIVDEGRRDAEVVKRKIEEEAKAEADRLIARAKREIGVATETAVNELYTIGARLATDVASKIITKELSPKDHERLIEESLGAMRSAERN
jgi:F-type H+-transporting ATPase subunit b